MTENRKEDLPEGEGDAWFRRNKGPCIKENESLDSDRIANLLEGLPLPEGPETTVFGWMRPRLRRLVKRKQRVERSRNRSDAINELKERGHQGFVGTADMLPVADKSIDLLIYGFCIYLCDREDLFQIAAEAHRVLKPNSWLAILDFWSPYHRKNEYHHKEGLNSYKYNTPLMFDWHPSYVVMDHYIRHHSKRNYTDEAQEWVSATVLRRCDDGKKTQNGKNINSISKLNK